MADCVRDTTHEIDCVCTVLLGMNLSAQLHQLVLLSDLLCQLKI